jgi:exodeoxyribonuclease-3
MKVVSFNVNSVRKRLHQIAALTESHAPDVIGLQETKVVDADFPSEALAELGYHSVFCGQKTHYGVALLSRKPAENVSMGFPGDSEEAQKRLISGTITAADGTRVRVINGYFPQGEQRDHPVKFPAKQAFYEDLMKLLASAYNADDPLIVMGDFNIAPLDVDIGIGEEGRKRWLRAGSTSFLPEEREWFQRLLDWGLFDTYREKYPESTDFFSWFDYRSKGFDREPKRGLRIDQVLATRSLNDRLVDCGIEYDIRAMESPSDHCPVWSNFDLD